MCFSEQKPDKIHMRLGWFPQNTDWITQHIATDYVISGKANRNHLANQQGIQMEKTIKVIITPSIFTSHSKFLIVT